MVEILKEEIEAITEDFKMTSYESFDEFVKQLRGYEKLTQYHFKLGECTKLKKMETDVEKKLIYSKFTLVCDHRVITGCDASMELGRYGDSLAFITLDKEHNHEPDVDKSYINYFIVDSVANRNSFFTLEYYLLQTPSDLDERTRTGGSSCEIFSYRSVERRLLYVRCNTRCCKAHWLGIQNAKMFCGLRSNFYHDHDPLEGDEDSDDELKPSYALQVYKACFQKALSIVARGLEATSKPEILKALDDAKRHFKKYMKKAA
ncbi:hypothetical protein Aperf_G00000097116 [Anoplocephala perfoliata]